MKFTLPWLKEHLQTDADLETITEKLTSLGLEVEDVADPGEALRAFSVAYVEEAVQHPNAERLRLCTVKSIHGTHQVVCGAPNARTGLYGIFAPTGSTIPYSGDVLKKAKIRGVESQGMLCSARELLVGDEHDGIIDLLGEPEIGTPATKILGIEGPVIEVGLTPDRADCFGVHGIARDLAAAGLGTLIEPDVSPVPGKGAPDLAIRFDFVPDMAAACPYFIGRRIKGVRNGPSPAWLQQRLKAIGLRPISALVDITNLASFDMCRPLHVFDAAKVAGAGEADGGLILRMAHDGEQLEALDGKTYEIDSSMTVIADRNGPLALGGIMGGEPSGCSDETTDVILEVAMFDPIRTASTGRRLGIDSDARTRFERGLDPLAVEPLMEWATRMIVDLCGGEPAPAVIVGTLPVNNVTVNFRPERVKKLTGVALDRQEIEQHLQALGFKLVRNDAGYAVTAPSWRHDISTEACIVEELIRLHGFDHVPPVAVRRNLAVSPVLLNFDQQRRFAMRRAAAEIGYHEAVTWSFMPEEQAEMFGGAPATMQNPLNAELAAMRPTLLANLLTAVARNIARRFERGAIFELGPRYTGDQPGDQVWALAGVRFGDVTGRHWTEPNRPVDAIDAKGDAVVLLEAANVKVPAATVSADAPAWYHPGRSGCLRLGPNVLASFGEIHPRVAKAFDIDVPLIAFEIDVDRLSKPKARAGRGRLPLEAWPYPAIDRDFAFIVDADVTAETLVRAVRGADKKLLQSVELFDVYAGKGIEDGKKSLAISVRLQAKDRTLSDDEVEPVAQKIVAAAEKSCGAVLRG